MNNCRMLACALRNQNVRTKSLCVCLVRCPRRVDRGIVVMSGPLEEMYNCFLFQRVPPSWEKAGYPCLKPLASWTEDFFGRIGFIGDWLMEGPRPSYWLSGFFFPQG